MIIECPNCWSKYNIDRSKAGGAGKRARCYKCGVDFPIVSEEIEHLSKLTEDLNSDLDSDIPENAPEKRGLPPEESGNDNNISTEFIEEIEGDIKDVLSPSDDDEGKKSETPRDSISSESKKSSDDDWDIDDLLADDALLTSLVETAGDEGKEEPQPARPAETSDNDIDIDNLLANNRPAETSVPKVEDKVAPPAKDRWTDDWDIGDLFAEDAISTTPAETTGNEGKEKPQPALPTETSVPKVEDKVVPPAKDSGKEGIVSQGGDKSPPKRSFKGYIMGVVLTLILLALASEGPSIIKRLRQAIPPLSGSSGRSFVLSIVERLKQATIDQAVKEETADKGESSAGSGGESLFGQAIVKRRQQIAADKAVKEETADKGEPLTPEGEAPKDEEDSATTEEPSFGEDPTKAISQEGFVNPTGRADMLQIGIIIPVHKNLEEVKVLDMVLNIEFTDDTVANVIRGNILFYEDNIKKSIDRFFNGKFYDDTNFVKGDLAGYIMDDINKTLKSGQVKRIEIEFLKDPTPEIPAGTEVKKK